MTSDEQQNIVVPANAFVPCPANSFKGAVSVLRRCGGGCNFFQGFIDVQAHGEFSARYRVQCAHPIARRMTTLEIE